jgi:hypothetical protein
MLCHSLIEMDHVASYALPDDTSQIMRIELCIPNYARVRLHAMCTYRPADSSTSSPNYETLIHSLAGTCAYE